MKKRTLLLIVAIILTPVIILFNYYGQPNYSSEKNWVVPRLKDQPTDTLVSKGTLPIHRWKNNKDTLVYFVPTETQPILDVLIVFDAGKARDNQLSGLANLFSQMLVEGTQKLTAENIASLFESKGAILRTKVDDDKLIVKFRAIADPNSIFLLTDTMADLLAESSFPEEAFSRIKKHNIVELKKSRQEPHSLGHEAFLKATYSNHPYGHTILGTLEGVQQTTTQDLKGFKDKYLVSKNAVIIIVGGIHRNQAKEISNRLTSKLNAGEKADALAKVSDLLSSSFTKIPFQSEQAHIFFGQPVESMTDPDFYTLKVGNYILGEGVLVSRLFKEVRNKRGLVYSIKSHFTPLAEPGPFVIQAQTKSIQADEVLGLIKENLVKFIEQGPTEEELTAAKKGIIGAFPLSFSSNAKIAELITDIAFYQLPVDYVETYPKMIETISKKDIQTVFEKRITPDKMATVIVGG